MDIKITDNKDEMQSIGKQIVESRKKIYTPLMLEKIRGRVKQEFPAAGDEELERLVYISIYDYWVYGNNIDEEFYYQFGEKNHQEKLSYLVDRVRTIYIDYLNCGDARAEDKLRRERIDLLEMKYRCYERLRKYYKRDVIEIEFESDFPVFQEFVKKHEEFVVKPSDFFYGIGVHKASIKDYSDVRAAFDSILKEGDAINQYHPSRKKSIVLEELIIQSQELSVLHESSVNGIRATAVRDKDGKVVIFHPWIKCGVGDQFVSSAALDGFDAEINPETGIIISDGYSENGRVYIKHPDSGIPIKGFQIPRWEELKELVNELMNQLAEYRYVGWDLVLTDDGWVVMEANYSGECMWQLIRNQGGRQEFEDLIGWKMDADYWWQVRPFPVS